MNEPMTTTDKPIDRAAELERIRETLANAPHPQSDALTDADLALLPKRDRELVLAARARRARKAKRS